MRMLLIAALLPLTAGCHASWEKDGERVAPSGKDGTRNFAASGFTGVDLRGPDDVDVKTGATFSVIAEGDAKALDELDIRIVDGVLRIGRKQQGGKWNNRDDGVRVHVVMPKVTSASVSGSGDLSVERAEGDFEGAVAGSGNLKIAALAAGNTELSIAGAGDINASGTAAKLTASIAGSGDIDVPGLTATGAEISIVGSGSVKGVVKGAASVSILGSGDVELSGGAKCAITKVGSGEARCS